MVRALYAGLVSISVAGTASPATAAKFNGGGFGYGGRAGGDQSFKALSAPRYTTRTVAPKMTPARKQKSTSSNDKATDSGRGSRANKTNDAVKPQRSSRASEDNAPRNKSNGTVLTKKRQNTAESSSSSDRSTSNDKRNGDKRPKRQAEDAPKPKSDPKPKPRPEQGPKPSKVACVGGVMTRAGCKCPPIAIGRTSGGATSCQVVTNNPPKSDGQSGSPRGPVVTPPVGSNPLPLVAGVLPLMTAMVPSRGAGTTESGPSGPGASPPTTPPITPPGQALPPASPPIQPAQTQPSFVPDEIIVSLASDAAPTLEDQVAQRFNLQILERTTVTLIGQRLVRLRIPDSRSVPAVVASLAAETTLAERQPNYIYRRQQGARVEPTDLQYALKKVGLNPRVDGQVAGQLTGKGAIVAIIDTGVDQTHPDLAKSNIRSFDATVGKGSDAAAHATAIAGIIAAQGFISGIAPATELLSVRAFQQDTKTAPPLSTSYILAKSFDWAVSEGAHVLNLSFAGPRDPMVEKVVRASDAKGVIMVAAVGNAGPKAGPAYPAAYPEVLAITAIDLNDKLYVDANQGAYVTLAAPGVDILTASAARGHDLQSGTSFAAAHVSGIVALMLQMNPRLTTRGARKALIDSAIDLGPPGRDDQFGAGLANTSGALKLVGVATP
jgi:subtilisin family serine protease